MKIGKEIQAAAIANAMVALGKGLLVLPENEALERLEQETKKQLRLLLDLRHKK